MSARKLFFSLLIVAMVVALPAIADERSGPVGRMTVSAAAVEWQPAGNYERLVLTVMTPTGAVVTREYQGRVTFRPADLAPYAAADGTYTYELRAVPMIAREVKARLANARAKDDDAAIAKIKAEAGVGPEVVQSGSFAIRNGSLVADAAEPAAGGPKLKASATALPLKPGTNDVVTADDEIIQGSLCVGLDCVVNENFGFDTIRLKENNTRIKFEDTSTSTGFPTHDWQLTANDSASGGQEKFSIEDITATTVPFTITGSAPTNSLFVASSGKVGFGNNAPVLNLSITATDTPAIRQEQTSGGGFTAQTWDIGANEANWFVRDVTGGSRLPLRIRPGAPTSSIDISVSGRVGVGTASPSSAQLHVVDSQAEATTRLQTSNAAGLSGIEYLDNLGNVDLFFGIQNSTSTTRLNSLNDNPITILLNSTERMRITNTGNVGINCNAPTFQLVIASGAGCSTPSSSINAGSTQFTAASSRTFKENIAPVAVPDILKKIESVPVVKYDFKNGGPKDRMGLIAEDFHQVFERGSDKFIDGQDVQMALWLAVQQLTEQNKTLTDRLAALEKQLASQKTQN